MTIRAMRRTKFRTKLRKESIIEPPAPVAEPWDDHRNLKSRRAEALQKKERDRDRDRDESSNEYD
jgi:hypothetical protein